MKLRNILLLIFSIMLFTACSGDSESVTTNAKKYTVVDPYIQGATFFWDKNNNSIKDNDEPLSTVSDDNGQFLFNINIPLGQKIMMFDKGVHNGISYTGELTSLITDKKLVSPLTTLEERYFKGKKTQLVNILNENLLDIELDDIDSDPMKSNKIEHIISTLAVDAYLKIDKFNHVDKNGTELSDTIIAVKDLIDFDISKANIEDTVSIMDYIVQKVHDDGNLDELLLLKESFAHQKKLKDILKNRADKTKPGRITYDKGELISKKAKIDSKKLTDNIFSFSSRPTKDEEVTLSIDVNATQNDELSWSIVEQPDDSNLILSTNEDKKSIFFTPLYKGNYRILFEFSDDLTLSTKIIEFNVAENLEMDVSKVKGYDSSTDVEELLGEIVNQSWVSSFMLNEAGITEIVSKYSDFTIVGYDKIYGLLIEYNDVDATVKENLVSLKYEFGIADVFSRVYEGDNAFKQMAIYPTDNGNFDDGGSNWHLESINMPEAWEYSKGDDSFLIGVCDGGYDTNHQDLSGRFAAILNYGDGGSNGDHGMAVTGTIGANTNNGIGISGINWNAKFVTSYMGTDYVQDVVETKQDGKEVRLVSNSWGVPLSAYFNPTDSYAATERFDYLQAVFAQRKYMIESKQDKLFLWAAGNGVGNGASATGYYGVDSKYDNGATHYTNNVLNKLDNLMVVAAFKDTSSGYVLTFYSNFGESVDIAAPTEFDSLKLNNGIYARFGGTSAATPVTSAVASLIMTINPNLTPKQVKEILIDSSTAKITQRYISPYSNTLEQLAIPIPILNAKEALKMAQETITPKEDEEGNPTISIDFVAELTDNFTPKATFVYFSFDKNYQVSSINSTIKSSIDGNTFNTYGTKSSINDIVEVSLDPNNRDHEITSVLTLKHIVTNETLTQTHVQKFTYSDMTITSKDAQSLDEIANADFKVYSSSIFKQYLVEGQTNSEGTQKIYLPFNMYNILGQKAGYKDSGAQSMIFEDKSYDVTLLFGLNDTPEAGNISGIVTNEINEFIEGATVEIFNGNISLGSTTTASNGYYQLRNITKRDGSGELITNFTMKVTKDSYPVQVRENVIVLDGKEREENFVLIRTASNQPPIAITGPDQVVLYGDTVEFLSTGSYDVDGNITAYQWRENETILSDNESFSTSMLEVGVHTITLIVTDNLGAIGADTVNIVVNELATYNWISQDWSICDGDCGINGGTQTRIVECKKTDGTLVGDNFCLQTKPATTQSCTTSLCDTDYYWKIGEWSICEGACGTSSGVQTREVICQDQNNYSVSENLCETAKPIESQSCVTENCEFSFGTITSGKTARVWLDRNMGSSKVCTSVTDSDCFGDYYQWGRESDGHQSDSSMITTTIPNSIQPSHSDFITFNLLLFNDWTSIDSIGADRAAFWNRSDGYGLCPKGYRVPTIDELKAEDIFDADDAYTKFKLPMAGSRRYSDGSFNLNGTYLWSNTPAATSSKSMQYTSENGHAEISGIRGYGMSIRCINDIYMNIPPISKIEVDNITITEGDTISFKGYKSSDADGFIVSYRWEEGDVLLSSSADFSTYTLTVGEHTISLRVTDNKGDTHITSVIINVVEKPLFHWYLGDWSTCEGACGVENGIQTRIVECRDSNGILQENNVSCSTPEPAILQNCTASYCDMEYKEIISPETGRIWLDRNIGAKTACRDSGIDDINCYGDYFQFGRNSDGHEKLSSTIIDNISNNIIPSHNYFIKSSFNYNYDWTLDDSSAVQRVQNWSDINGNGVCPVGYRVPTKEEFIAESITSSTIAKINLQLPVAGYRDYNGNMLEVGQNGYLFTTSIFFNTALSLKYENTNTGVNQFVGRKYSNAFNVRCIKAKSEEIIVNNPPTANAGADQVVTFGETVYLNADQSYDIDGVIDSYLWEGSSGVISEQSSFNITDLSTGTHLFNLTVMDNDGATSIDTIQIDVNSYNEEGYNWISGSWSECIGDCGNNEGEQTRTVICKDTNDNNVTDNNCVSTKPLDLQVCTAKLCIEYNEINSTVTHRIWMDRNLGASRVCESVSDELCYGDYYQWGRNVDGHEKVTSLPIVTISSDIFVGSDDFILSTESKNYDWLSIDGDGVIRESNWSKTDGTNICPIGFRLPTSAELIAENIDNTTEAFNNLKLPLSGLRDYETGDIYDQGYSGGLWSSTPNGTNSMYLHFGGVNDWSFYSRASGRSVRCIKD